MKDNGTMKIFALADPHGDRRLLKEVLKEVETNDYNVFIGLGDYIDKSYFSDLVTSIDVDKKAFIPGNRDYRLKELPYLKDIDSFDFEGIRFVTVGSYISSNLKKSIKDRSDDVNGDELVICSHEPPYRARDEIHSGQRVGVEDFREIIEEKEPLAWLCGHIHEAEGVSTVGKTKVINAAASDDVLGYSLTINNNTLEEVKRVER